ncbi:MAG: toll/interleukin-1 receptor domain-containing protein, partial [Chloroflexi bacterium]
MRIFISYSRRNKTFADRIAQELRARGADVFIDYQRLDAGNFVAQLGKEVQSREVFLLIVSPHSLRSRWVQAEVNFAFMDADKTIIPLLLEDPSPEDYAHIFPVASMEMVDARRWWQDGDISEALKKLERLLNLQPPAQPVDIAPPPV